MSNDDFDEFKRAFYAELSGDTNEALVASYRTDRFTENFLQRLGDFGIVPDLAVGSLDKPLGSARVLANAWGYEEEEGCLYLAVTKFHDFDSSESVPLSEVNKAIERAVRVVEFLEKIPVKDLEPSSFEYDAVSRLSEVRQDIRQIRVFFLTDGKLKEFKDFNFEKYKIPVYAGIWDMNRLYRLVMSGRPYDSIEVNFIEKFGSGVKCLEMPAISDEYRGYLAIIPGEILAKLYDEYGARLMELNVRSFLQQRGSVNRGIRETILNEPGRFLAYNNGISATAESIETARSDTGDLEIRSIKGLQVVNGGQTVASIHRAATLDRCKHLGDIGVQAKITVVNPDLLEELVPAISRFSNTQNKVNEADFASNDPFHVELEKLANSIWVPGERSRWFYERARGQYEVARLRKSGTSAAKRKVFDTETPKSQVFDKTDFAKYYHCWDQKPHLVSLGAQKNFVRLMADFAKRKTSFVPDEAFYKQLIAKAIIWKYADKVAKKMRLAYKAAAATYTVALVSFKTVGRLDLHSVWSRQSVSNPLADIVEEWMPVVHDKIIETAAGRNVTEWAKKPDCWQEIQLLDVGIPESLEMELRDGDPLPNVGREAVSGEQKLTTVDRENINRVLQHDEEFWWALVKWTKGKDILNDFQKSIVMTIVDYASSNWRKIPSHKQAKHVVAALNAALQAGFDPDHSED